MDKSHIESKALPIFVVLDIASFSLLIAGYFVPYWFSSPVLNIYYGLWFARSCLPSQCVDIWYMDQAEISPKLERWDSVRVFQSLAVVGGVISLVFAVAMYVLRHKSATSRSVTQGMFFASSLFAGLMALIGVVLFISKVNKPDMMWGPILPGVAAFLFIFSGVFTLVICRYNPNYLTGGENIYTIEQTAL